MKQFRRRVYIFGLLFVFLGGLNTLLGHHLLERKFHDEIKNHIILKLDNIIEHITADIDRAENALNVSAVLVSNEEDEEKIERFFQGLLDQNESFVSVFLGTPDNEKIYVSDTIPSAEVLDVRTRPWYIDAAKEGKLIFTAPYLHAYDGTLVVTLALPVYDENHRLKCILGIDKSLEGMKSFLESQKATKNGRSLLFDRNGSIIVCPCEDFDIGFPQNISDITTISPATFGENTTGMHFTNLRGGEDGYLRWQRLADLGLTVATFAPLDDLVNRLVLNVQMILVTGLSYSIMFVLLLLFLHRYILRPMQELDNDVMAIPIDDLSYRLPIRRSHFFGTLRKTLNRSLNKTQEYFEDVINQQEELEASYEQLLANEQQLQTQYDEIIKHRTQIQYLADHDPLTGLFNRRKFAEHLLACLEEEQVGAIFMLDIDNFKNINDIQGHVYGDRVLQSVTRLLEESLPSKSAAYRFGGDEFLVLIKDETNPERLKKHIGQIFDCLSQTRIIEGRVIHLTASAGIVLYPRNGKTVDELLIKVDIAMHSAKKKGKNLYKFFEDDMAATFSQKVHIERILVEAIQTKNFMLLYQPIIDTVSGSVAYFEALIRIKDFPISPAEFIPIAEESNLILPIGRWVMEEAVRQLLEWEQTGKELKPIAINFSPKQFFDQGLEDFLFNLLQNNNIDPSLIEIEITESVFIDNVEEVVKIINSIKMLGIKISLDDFGTGYSSINYITRIPVDRIKLDRSLTGKLSENLPVLESLVAIAHGLNMEVVGEGVEKINESYLLSKSGCDYLQGYLFSMPVRAETAHKLLEKNFSALIFEK